MVTPLATEISVNQEMWPVFIGLLLVAALSWIFLSRRLYKLLLEKYPLTYAELGSPKLLMKKSFSANYRIMRYLYSRDFLSTEDPEVIRLGNGLRYILFIYVFCLLGSLVLLLAGNF